MGDYLSKSSQLLGKYYEYSFDNLTCVGEGNAAIFMSVILVLHLKCHWPVTAEMKKIGQWNDRSIN